MLIVISAPAWLSGLAKTEVQFTTMIAVGLLPMLLHLTCSERMSRHFNKPALVSMAIALVIPLVVAASVEGHHAKLLALLCFSVLLAFSGLGLMLAYRPQPTAPAS